MSDRSPFYRLTTTYYDHLLSILSSGTRCTMAPCWPFRPYIASACLLPKAGRKTLQAKTLVRCMRLFKVYAILVSPWVSPCQSESPFSRSSAYVRRTYNEVINATNQLHYRHYCSFSKHPVATLPTLRLRTLAVATPSLII